MKILDNKTTKRGVETIVEFNKKQFLRIKTNRFTQKQMNSVQVIEWKRLKTNHLVGKDEHNKLESEFVKIDVTTTKTPKDDYRPLMVSGFTTFNKFTSAEEDSVDKKHLSVKLAAEAMLKKEGASLLSVVKFIKDSTGYGLRESKDIADALKKKIDSDRQYEEIKRKMFDSPTIAKPRIKK
jgi:ribosomal protein L7/L12